MFCDVHGTVDYCPECIESDLRTKRDKETELKEEKINNLLKIIRDFAASNAWQNFGDSRRFGGRLLQPHEIDEIASKLLEHKG